MVDEALDTRWLDALNAFAPRIEVVSTCAGHPEGAHFTLQVRRPDLAGLVAAIPLYDLVHVTVFRTPDRDRFSVVVAPNERTAGPAWWPVAAGRAVRAMRRLVRRRPGRSGDRKSDPSHPARRRK